MADRWADLIRSGIDEAKKPARVGRLRWCIPEGGNSMSRLELSLPASCGGSYDSRRTEASLPSRVSAQASR